MNLPPQELLSSLPLTYLNRSYIKKTRSEKIFHNIPSELLTVFEDEIEKLTHFKSASQIFFDIERNGSWTPDSTGKIASKNIFELLFLRFANFLINNHYIRRPEEPLTKGENKYDILTIGLFCNKQLVIDFIWSTSEKSNSKFNYGHLNALSIISSLLRAKTGYLFQNSSFAKKIGLDISEDQWKERCLSTRSDLVEFRRKIAHAERTGSELFAFGRDPEDRIKWILDLDDPLTPISEMIKLMSADLPKFSFNPLEQAKHFQAILLVALIQHNPLRVSMFAKMKFGEHLLKGDDGRWWLRFKRSEFKNRAFLKTDYCVMLNPSLSPLIDVYYSTYYPLLTDDIRSNFVFLKKDRKNRSVGRSAGEISILLEFLSRCYIPGCEGFCGHSYRHIVATAIVKKKPNREGISEAAAALHDSPQTVERRYAHLKSNDLYAPVNRFSTELYEKHGLLDTFSHLTEFHIKSEVRYGE